MAKTDARRVMFLVNAVREDGIKTWFPSGGVARFVTSVELQAGREPVAELQG